MHIITFILSNISQSTESLRAGGAFQGGVIHRLRCRLLVRTPKGEWGFGLEYRKSLVK